MKFQLKTYLYTLTATALMLPHYASAHDESHNSSSRADAHAPISIMADHTHKQNEWMFSYRYMQMHMEGMRNGTKQLSASDLFAAGYTVAPESMDMDMHMFGLMYAPNDKITLMLMTNYSEIEMEHRIYPGAPAMLLNVVGGDHFTTRTSGWGDTKLSAIFQLHDEAEQKVYGSLGLSVPTGSIKEKDQTPRPGMPPSFPNQQLPAPMQLGSGSYDLLPTLTYIRHLNQWSYGIQGSGIIRLEETNNQGYRLGHRFQSNLWLSYLLDRSLSVNTGLRYRYDGKMHGEQNKIGQMGPNGRSVPTAFSENYGGERIDVSIGANYIFTATPLKGHRLAAELHLPVWQDLNGVQMETDWTLTLGWQKAF